MTYNKPQIDVLGEAVRVIQQHKDNEATTDGTPPQNGALVQFPPPAYELDE